MKQWLVYLLPLLLSACQGDKMRCELQRVDSLNSSDALLDTITTMPEVVDYYDLWGTDNDRMTAHYLLGCVFRDQNNTPMALGCYRDAVSFADTIKMGSVPGDPLYGGIISSIHSFCVFLQSEL